MTSTLKKKKKLELAKRLVQQDDTKNNWIQVRNCSR